MVDHDKNVGQLLDLLDRLGIAEDTIVVYSTDNGAAHEHLAGRGDDAVPQREEHELGRRLPRALDRPLAGEDPGRGRLQRDRAAPRLAADLPRRGGRARRRREAEARARGRREDVQGAHRRLQPAAVPHGRGASKSPRHGLHLLLGRRRPRRAALRQLEARLHGAARARGTLEVWAEPFVPLRVPKLFNLRTDPFERADTTSNTYWDWYLVQGLPRSWPRRRSWASSSQTFVEFPPRQKAASFTIDQALEKMARRRSTPVGDRGPRAA